MYLVSKNGSKYNSARISLLIIVIVSVLNLFTILFSGVYFVFSSYFTQVLGGAGYMLYAETKEVIYPIVTTVLGIISVVPYLLCWIFSKKRFGWMVASLVIFCVDSAGFLFDMIGLLAIGEFSMTIDLVIRVLLIVEFAIAVKCGKAYFAELKVQESAINSSPVYDNDGNIIAFSVTTGGVPVDSANIVSENADAKVQVVEENTDETAQETQENAGETATVKNTRLLTINRKKSFVGCAVAINIFVNGVEVTKLKNGQSVTLEIPTAEISLGASFGVGVGTGGVTVGAGQEDTTYEMLPKMGFVSNEIVFTKIN